MGTMYLHVWAPFRSTARGYLKSLKEHRFAEVEWQETAGPLASRFSVKLPHTAVRAVEEDLKRTAWLVDEHRALLSPLCQHAVLAVFVLTFVMFRFK